MRMIIVMLLALNFSALAQDESWNSITKEKANSGKLETYLTANEKKVIYYINLVRMNPRLFETSFIVPYLKKYGINENNISRSMRSLQSQLKATRPMNPIKPTKDLTLTAKKHALDMGLAGKSGHKSSTGKKYNDRMKPTLKRYYECFENCQYGLKDPLEIVLDLLIDDGVEGAPHRRSLLNPSTQYIGASTQPHIVYKYNTVIELGGHLN